VHLKVFSNRPTAFTQTKCYGAVEALVKQLHQDPSRIWNSVELHKHYEVEKCCHVVCLLTTSGICFTQTCLLSSLGMASHPGYPGQSPESCKMVVCMCVWHLLLCSEARHLLHFALRMMLIMTATLKLCQALVEKSGMSVLYRSQIPAHVQHRYH